MCYADGTLLTEKLFLYVYVLSLEKLFTISTYCHDYSFLTIHNIAALGINQLVSISRAEKNNTTNERTDAHVKCHHAISQFYLHLLYKNILCIYKLKTFKASLYSSEKHFLFDNCGIMLYGFLLFCCELGQIYCSVRECGRCHQIVTPVTE